MVFPSMNYEIDFENLFLYIFLIPLTSTLVIFVKLCKIDHYLLIAKLFQSREKIALFFNSHILTFLKFPFQSFNSSLV